jgi:hypothetical protein
VGMALEMGDVALGELVDPRTKIGLKPVDMGAPSGAGPDGRGRPRRRRRSARPPNGVTFEDPGATTEAASASSRGRPSAEITTTCCSC